MKMASPSAGDPVNLANVPVSSNNLHKLARRLLELGCIFDGFLRVAAAFLHPNMTIHRTIAQLVDIL
ncbi:hypothetical protein FNYG_00537 [Fusarium nygamai]|uniref:Uncharacterized protein n=1 Tax=Gibberella nygamai TaxID=42673 RepID=A0A2K0WVL7_GIBNY|nr:hypothetical protein FNYG_00537 [Fusarium nygamai]